MTGPAERERARERFKAIARELADLIPEGEAIVFSREGYSLRQIDALASAAAETEQARAVAEDAKMLAQHEAKRAVAAAAETERLRESLRLYGKHGLGCSSRQFPFDLPCDCGLAAALAVPQADTETGA